MISFKNVNKWYGELHVLNSIDLEVAHGEVVVVCGPSGSGKSTLIRCINRLEPIQQGELIVDGMKVHDKKSNMTKIRAEIGFVFQSFNLYPHMTALENVTIAPIKVRKINKEEAEKLGKETLIRVGWRRSSGWDWEIESITIRPNSRAVNSSAWPSPEVWACDPKSCSLTNLLRPLIRR
jgi:polar amino acid transport system ATP-binding protein